FSLTQAAAQALANQGATAQNVPELGIGVALMTDPAMHGTVADAHLAGIDVGTRAVLVLERNKAGLVYDPEATPGHLLAKAARQARVRTSAAAGVLSLAIATTDSQLVISTAPRAAPGPAIRPPAVAGRFYPADPAEL